MKLSPTVIFLSSQNFKHQATVYEYYNRKAENTAATPLRTFSVQELNQQRAYSQSSKRERISAQLGRSFASAQQSAQHKIGRS